MNTKPPLSVWAMEMPETSSPMPLLLLEAAPVAEAEPGAPEESVTTPENQIRIVLKANAGHTRCGRRIS